MLEDSIQIPKTNNLIDARDFSHFFCLWRSIAVRDVIGSFWCDMTWHLFEGGGLASETSKENIEPSKCNWKLLRNHFTIPISLSIRPCPSIWSKKFISVCNDEKSLLINVVQFAVNVKTFFIYNILYDPFKHELKVFFQHSHPLSGYSVNWINIYDVVETNQFSIRSGRLHNDWICFWLHFQLNSISK